MKLPLPIHSYQHTSRPVGVERLVNCFAEKAPPEGKSPTALMRSPGIVTAATPTAGIGRGLFKFKNRLYAIIGQTLYRMSSANVLTSIGTVTGSSIISFAQTPTQATICDQSASYTYDETTFAQITDGDFANGAQCCDIDGYILFRKPNSGQFFGSALNNASSYDALDFATAEGNADEIVGIIADHRQAILAGADSMELWYNGGGSGFPFIRDTNGFIELGCAAGATLAKADNSVYWLASDLTIRRLEGLTPVRVSQHGVEQAIASYTVSDAYAFGYSQAGHIFYVIDFPTSNASWVYDATTTEWHERQRYGYASWKISGAQSCYNKVYVQDSLTGKIGYLDINTSSDWEDTQRMEFTFPGVYLDGNRYFHNSLELRVETGVGTVSGQGVNPQMTLEVSDNGGRDWSTMPTRSLGLIGERKTLVIWDRLGYADDRVYRVSISDPVKTIISDAQLDIEGFNKRAA